MNLPTSQRPFARRSPWQIQRAVVFALMMRELKTRFEGRWTGVVWLFGQPMAELLMFLWMNTVLRGRINRQGYDFIVFLLAALVGWRLFKTCWQRLSHGVNSNRGLFGFRQVKPMDTFIARALLEVALELTTFILIALVLARLGYSPLVPRDPLAWLSVLVVFVLLGVGMGITFAVLIDVAPRIDNLVHVLSMPLMILSGVIFHLDRLPAEVMQMLQYNPLLHLVELSRAAYLPGYVPIQGTNAVYPCVFTLVMLTIAMVLYRWRRQQLIAS